MENSVPVWRTSQKKPPESLAAWRTGRYSATERGMARSLQLQSWLKNPSYPEGWKAGRGRGWCAQVSEQVCAQSWLSRALGLHWAQKCSRSQCSESTVLKTNPRISDVMRALFRDTQIHRGRKEVSSKEVSLTGKLFSNFPSDVLLCLPDNSFNIEQCRGAQWKIQMLYLGCSHITMTPWIQITWNGWAVPLHTCF